jgi:DNA-binding IclR family transcriptional regulator
MPGSAELLHRQLAVLRCCAAGGPQRFADLVAVVAAPPSTAVRLLRALESIGLLRRNRAGRYLLAAGATALALALLDHSREAGSAGPVLEALARESGASASCWALDGRRMVLLAKHEVADGFHYIDRFDSQPPAQHPFGLMLIASLPTAARERLLRGCRPDARRLAARAAAEPVLACVQPWDQPFWRVCAVVAPDSGLLQTVGVSRHARPAPSTAERDRHCVLAAARRLAAARDGDPFH